MNDNNSQNKKPAPEGGSKKIPFAVILWVLLFIALGALIVYSHEKNVYKQMDQTTFMSQLNAGKVSTVNLTPEGDQIMMVEGKLKGKNINGKDNRYKARVVYSDSVDQIIRSASKKNNAQVTVLTQNTWLRNIITTMLIILIPVGILYLLFSRQIKSAGKGAMQFGKSKARMIFPNENSVKFADVAGVEEAKEETKEIMDYLQDPIKFKLLGAKIPKGAMLMGPPGTGKTMLAKAIAGEAEVPFFAISGSDFVEMFVGVGASRVRDMFEQARKHAPCLIFIDEIDAVGRSRFSGIGGGHDEREQTLNAMLVEMDGLETQEGVIVIAATNRPDVLDPALQRPGRFDRQIVLDLPDIKGRRQILDVHAKKIKLAKEVDLDIIARGTPGFSGADLANLVNEAALLAARQDEKEATMPDLEEARDKVRWGRERRSKSISEKERRITAYHEAGHTLASIFTDNSMPLHKVTIIPRGVAYLGATMHLPSEDRYTQNRSELKDELVILMGGRVAEEIAFGEITSGAAGDIGQASKIVKQMVCSFGMSDKLGCLNYGGREEHIYLGRDITKTEDYSEATAREIDIEMKKLIDEATSRCRKLLNDHKDKLIKLSEKLLEVETMDEKEVRIAIGMEVKEEVPSTKDTEETATIKTALSLEKKTDNPSQEETKNSNIKLDKNTES